MSQDRKTRVKGDRVIHTVKGSPYRGDAAERPAGLTTEQAEDQRVGTKIHARQTREAAQGDGMPSAVGNVSARQKRPAEGRRGSDELSSTPKRRR
jgi:hypothetical protein